MPVKTKISDNDENTSSYYVFKDKNTFVYCVLNEETGEFEPVGIVESVGEYDGE